jgi:hypothetical protein
MKLGRVVRDPTGGNTRSEIDRIRPFLPLNQIRWIIFVAQLFNQPLAITACPHYLNKTLQSAGISYCCRDPRAVEVGSKANAVVADTFENVFNVVEHQFHGRVHIVPTILAEEARGKVDADHASGFMDCLQLIVSEISRMGTQSMCVGMGSYEGRVANASNVPKSTEDLRLTFRWKSTSPATTAVPRFHATSASPRYLGSSGSLSLSPQKRSELSNCHK